MTDAKIHITIYQADNIINETVPADSSGRFYLGNIDISGDARLVASAVDRNGNPNGLLLLDSMNYIPAEISGYLPASGVVKKEDALTLIQEDSVKEKEFIMAQEYEIRESVRKKYRLTDTIPIGEVKITAPKPKDIQVAKIESVRSLYGGEPDAEIIVTPQLETVPAAPMLLMGTVAGVRVTGPVNGVYSIQIRTGIYYQKSPLLLVDGIKRDINTLSILPVSMIDRIDVLKSIGKTAVYGLDGNFGVISVITRSGNRMTKNLNRLNILSIQGFQDTILPGSSIHPVMILHNHLLIRI